MAAQTEGLNKEKIAFLLTAAVLSYLVYEYLQSAPEDLVVGDPTIEFKAPKKIADADREIPEVAKYLAGVRNPFVIPKLALVQPVKTDPLANPGNKPDVPPPPPPTPKPDDTASKPTISKKRPMDLPVEFMGIVGTEDGQYVALLRNKDGSPPLRIRAGDTLETSKLKVVKIEPEQITVEDTDGQRYALKGSDVAKDVAEAPEGKPHSKKHGEKPKHSEKPKDDHKEKPAKTDDPSKTNKVVPNPTDPALLDILRRLNPGPMPNPNATRHPNRNSRN